MLRCIVLLARGWWVALLFAVQGASAFATLDISLTNVTCGISGPTGSTYVDCGPDQPGGGASFVASLETGQAAFINATLTYKYRDDGLALPAPGFAYFDAQTFFWGDYEFGAIRLLTNACVRVYDCLGPGYASYGSSGGLVLGLNDTPDLLMGSLEVFSYVGAPISPLTAGVSIGWSEFIYSVGDAPVPAVPEPSTYALMVVGLLAVVAARRRSVHKLHLPSA